VQEPSHKWKPTLLVRAIWVPRLVRQGLWRYRLLYSADMTARTNKNDPDSVQSWRFVEPAYCTVNLSEVISVLELEVAFTVRV
jgi:hypothetical protein